MFDHRHYVPVLKWKRGERIALRYLPFDVKSRLTPLIEIVPKHFADAKSAKKLIESIVEDKASEIENDWGLLPFFLDVHLVESSYRTSADVHLMIAIHQMLRDRNLTMIPVTGLHRATDHYEAVASVLEGTEFTVCVRLTAEDLRLPDVNDRIDRLLSTISRRREQVHLIVDYKSTADATPSLLVPQQVIEHLDRYSTFTVISGAFPQDLTEFEKNRQYTHERADWLSWHNQVFASSPGLVRIPTFGDYTILHPQLVSLSFFPNVSASIRYTSDSYWVIMRGEGLNNEDGPGRSQYPAQSLLVQERDEFCGENFSAGDQYLRELGEAMGQSKGSPESLIRAGVNHHITFVVKQISELFVNTNAV